MKLATYQDGSRDGQLVVVSQDLTQAHFATHIATKMQQVLDDWNFMAPQLELLYQQLNQAKAPYPFAFEPGRCMAPLPRPVGLVQTNAYEAVVNSDAKLHCVNASAATMHLLQPQAILSAAGEGSEGALDFTAGLAVVTGDIEQGADSCVAIEGIRLLMLNSNLFVNRAGIQHHVFSGFSPVAVTCDELGDVWKYGKVHLRLDVFLNEQPIARCPVADGMVFSFADIAADLCQFQPVMGGTILCSGSVMHTDKAKGYTSIALKRLHEQQETGEGQTPYLQPGDRLRMEMKGKDGHALMGTVMLNIPQNKSIDVLDE